jgi:hypothetical protein
MELLELGWALVEGCGCLLEILALTTDVGAGVAGVRALRQRKERRAAGEPGAAGTGEEAGSGYERAMWVFLGLAALGAFLTGLVLWKWLR